MFIGEYQHNVDSKGRLAVPAKFKNKLREGAVVTRGLDNCLFLYPKGEWEKLAKRLAELPISQKDSRAFVRLMLAGAMDLEMDKQGRINLPKYLMDYASLRTSAIVAGLYSRVEIWDKATWTKYKNAAEKNSTDISEKMKELGI